MCYYDEYKNCKRCGLVKSRFYQYNSYNLEEDDTCMVCGDSKSVVLIEENNETKYKEMHSEGFGSIHIHYKNGKSEIILLEKALEKHEIKHLKDFLSQDRIDKDNSSVMLWNTEKSKLEVSFGRDLRKVYVENNLNEEYSFKEMEEGEICI